jgi:hypothetical protein
MNGVRSRHALHGFCPFRIEERQWHREYPAMNLFDATLGLHIACGTAGLVLGPVAMTARKVPGLHTRAGEWYHRVMLMVCISAAAMAVLEWQRIGWLLPIAVWSYAFALLGYVSAKRRFHHWLRFHLIGQGGSYIAMVTALLVVNLGTGTWWAWAAPTIAGTPVIAWVSREIARGRRPGY